LTTLRFNVPFGSKQVISETFLTANQSLNIRTEETKSNTTKPYKHQ